MNKIEMVQKISESTHVERGTVSKVFDGVFELIAAEVSAGCEVAIKNFGMFKVVDVKEREGHDPRTGKKIIIPAHKRPLFKASKIFKEKVN